MADETKKVSQQGFYARPAAADTEDCPQCFYTNEATKADESAQRVDADDCPQCFYTPSGESK